MIQCRTMIIFTIFTIFPILQFSLLLYEMSLSYSNHAQQKSEKFRQMYQIDRTRSDLKSMGTQKS